MSTIKNVKKGNSANNRLKTIADKVKGKELFPEKLDFAKKSVKKLKLA